MCVTAVIINIVAKASLQTAMTSEDEDGHDDVSDDCDEDDEDNEDDEDEDEDEDDDDDDAADDDDDDEDEDEDEDHEENGEQKCVLPDLVPSLTQQEQEEFVLNVRGTFLEFCVPGKKERLRRSQSAPAAWRKSVSSNTRENAWNHEASFTHIWPLFFRKAVQTPKYKETGEQTRVSPVGWWKQRLQTVLFSWLIWMLSCSDHFLSFGIHLMYFVGVSSLKPEALTGSPCLLPRPSVSWSCQGAQLLILSFLPSFSIHQSICLCFFCSIAHNVGQNLPEVWGGFLSLTVTTCRCSASIWICSRRTLFYIKYIAYKINNIKYTAIVEFQLHMNIQIVKRYDSAYQRLLEVKGDGKAIPMHLAVGWINASRNEKKHPNPFAWLSHPNGFPGLRTMLPRWVANWWQLAKCANSTTWRSRWTHVDMFWY